MAGTTYAYSAYLNYSERITADEITVILNGTTYTVPRQEDEGGSWYGSIELYGDGEAECQYPFCIYHESNRNKLLVSYDVYTNHNPVSVEITQESGVTTTPCFEKAVRSVVSPLVVEATPAPYEATGASPSYLNASGDEIMEAMTTRGAVVRDPYGAVYSVLFVGGGSVTIGNGLYHSTTQQTEFETYAYTEGSDGLRYPPEAHQ